MGILDGVLFGWGFGFKKLGKKTQNVNSKIGRWVPHRRGVGTWKGGEAAPHRDTHARW
jgi:hypothetical protein